MVNVEDITEKEQAGKDKIRETKNLLEKYFPNSSISVVGNIHVSEKKEPYQHILIMGIGNTPEIILFSPEYFGKAMDFANEYETNFSPIQIHFKTDYSNMPDLSQIS